MIARFDARRTLLHGLVLGGLFTVVVVVSLRIDARLWIDDYPPDIQAAVGASVRAPFALQLATAVVLFGILLGGIVASNWRIARDCGWTSGFRPVFLHTLVVFWVVNVIDVLVVDWLVLVAIQPDFVVLPGTEGLAGYHDYTFHLKASLSWQPWVGSLMLAALMGAILPALWRRRRGDATATVDGPPAT